MKFVIDTSIIIDKLRGGNSWDDFRRDIDENSEFYISSIAIFELFLGLSTRKPDVRNKIVNFLKYFRIIDVNPGIARKGAEIARDVVKVIEAADCLIAATAIKIGAQVVTLNKKHFEKIPGVAIFSA